MEGILENFRPNFYAWSKCPDLNDSARNVLSGWPQQLSAWIREGPCPGSPARAPWSSLPERPGLCVILLPTLWLSYTLTEWYFQNTVMCSRISFPWLAVLPICGVIKLCALKAGRRYAVGENWEPAWMTGFWGSCPAPGLHTPRSPLLKGGWELTSNTQTTSAIGYKPDWKYTPR